MAHYCALCYGDCFCNGDWDDCIVSKTPVNCESCGCASEEDGDVDFFDDEDEEYSFNMI